MLFTFLINSELGLIRVLIGFIMPFTPTQSAVRVKKKVIPTNIEDLLTPLTLAIWIMDDGGKHPSGMILSTYCFSMKDMILLQKALHTKFDIETNVLLRKAGPIIYIPKSQLPKLSKIVAPYVKKHMAPGPIVKNWPGKKIYGSARPLGAGLGRPWPAQAEHVL